MVHHSGACLESTGWPMICYSTLLEGAIQLPERSTTMACKAVFYLKATALLLTLAVSSLVGCSDPSITGNENDAGVTTDVTPDDATGGRTSVIGSQSSVVGQTGGSSSITSTGGSSAVGSNGGSSTDAGSETVYNAVYVSGVYHGGSITAGFKPGECPSGEVRIDCICVLGGNNSFTSFDNSCSPTTLQDCISKDSSTGSGVFYTYFWSCK